MDQLRAVFAFLFAHKLKYLAFVVSLLVFAVALFPFQDLGDLVGAQVAKSTNNQVVLQFDNMHLGFFGPSVALDNLSFETPALPVPLTVQELEIEPTMGALISQKPAGSIHAKGLFRGEVTVSMVSGKTTDAGVQMQALKIKAENMSLDEIHKVAELPVLIKGKLNVDVNGAIDPAFQEQPDMDVDLRVDHLEVPSSMINTMMGPLNLPELKLSSVALKGRLTAGRFIIEKGQIGKEGDEMSGSIKGEAAFVVQNKGGINPVLGSYNLSIDLSVKRSFQDKASLFLSFLDAYKSPLSDGARYQFKINASSPQMPPNLTAIH